MTRFNVTEIPPKKKQGFTYLGRLEVRVSPPFNDNDIDKILLKAYEKYGTGDFYIHRNTPEVEKVWRGVIKEERTKIVAINEDGTQRELKSR